MNSNFYVDFKGTTIFQLEPAMVGQHKTMPVTLTVGGRCTFTAENYQDFRVMMRTKAQSAAMNIAPNGNFDWPDVQSLLLCPSCGRQGPVPQPGSPKRYEYWMVFYPLLQITLLKGTQMTLGTRTICRFMCLDCMEDLLEGLSLRIHPGGSDLVRPEEEPHDSTLSRPDYDQEPVPPPTTTDDDDENLSHRAPPPPPRVRRRLTFNLPAADVLAEAGSASFLDDSPPRPETTLHSWHGGSNHVNGTNTNNSTTTTLSPSFDDILDAWTLYNLWEHAGAWEALQNDYRLVLSRSMHPDHNQNNNPQQNPSSSSSSPSRLEDGDSGGDAGGHRSSFSSVSPLDDPRFHDRVGQSCSNPACGKVHGSLDPDDETTMVRLAIKCRDCMSAYYCSRACREAHRDPHQLKCRQRQVERDERRRERKAKRVACDTCQLKFPYNKMKKCSRCRLATYCSVECQKGNWDQHKLICKKAM